MISLTMATSLSPRISQVFLSWWTDSICSCFNLSLKWRLMSDMETVFRLSLVTPPPLYQCQPTLAVNTEIMGEAQQSFTCTSCEKKNCLNSKLKQKKKKKTEGANVCGRFGDRNKLLGDLFSIHESPHHPRKLECIGEGPC